MMEDNVVTVGELITLLGAYDPNEPVYVRKYSCGRTFEEVLVETDIDISYDDKVILLMDYN